MLIDDCYRPIAPLLGVRPGAKPLCSASELLTMALVGEARGLDRETDRLAFWADFPDLFPPLPERSRFNRRRRNLMEAVNLLRQVLLETMDVGYDRQCAIASLPVPVIQWHLVAHSPSQLEWKVSGARFGKGSAKKQKIFGYKLHWLVTLRGLDFVLAGAHENDITIAPEVLAAHSDLLTLGDKG